MSLIHEALQNVESSFSNKENNNISEQLHNKNKLYKVNKFNINLSNSLMIFLVLSSFLSVLYIFYAEFKAESLTAQDNHEIPYVNDVSIDAASESDDLLLSDINLESIELNESIVKPTSLVVQLDDERTDAIEGGIVDSKNHELNSADLLEIKKVNKPLLIESDNVYELKNNDIIEASEAYIDESIVAKKSNIESDYFLLQEQAYQHIVNKEFTLAVPVLKSILSKDSNDYYANVNMVLIDIESNRFKEANRRLQKLESLYPYKVRVKELMTIVKANKNG